MPELQQTVLDNKLHCLGSPVTPGWMHICVTATEDELSRPAERTNADYTGGRYTIMTSGIDLNIDQINDL